MKIKTKMWVAFAGCVVAVFGVSMTLVYWYGRALRLGEITATANEIVRTAFDVEVLTSEYLRYIHQESERTLAQRKSRAAHLAALIERAKSLEFQVEALGDIQSSLDTTEQLFDRLEGLQGRHPTDPEEGQQLEELERLLASRIFEHFSKIVIDADRIHRLSLEERESSLRLILVIVLVSQALILLVIVATMILVLRGIVEPLEQLHHGAEFVAAGNLDHKIGLRRPDEVGRLAAAFDDMTLRLKQRTTRMKQTLDSLETFSYSIAHDLRAPIRAIQSFTSILREEYQDRFDSLGQDYARRIIEASTRLDHLVRDLLAYSHVAQGPERLAPLSLRQVLQEVATELAPEIQTAGAVIEIRDPLPAVLGDELMLRKVLANLLSNAIKFVSPGTQPLVTLEAREEKSRVRLRIQDNGIGIEPEYQQKIFRVFERLHPIDRYPGTGIGLAIVFKAAERMGGRVWVESTPGRGSAFWLELPAASQTEPVPELAGPPPQPES